MAVTGAILVDSSVLSKETQKIRFIISKETTAEEITSKILARFNMSGRDPNLFYITMETPNKTSELAAPQITCLQNNSRPLDMQLQAGTNAKFCVQMRSGGVVKIYDNCLTSASFYKSMFVSKHTTSHQLIVMLLNHYGVTEAPENFLLAKLDDNGKELGDLNKHDCPLAIQQQTTAKISFCLKRLKKTSNLSRGHSFHGVSDYQTKHQHLSSLRRSIKKGKNIRFEDEQAEEDRDEAIEQLRSSLHQLTNNKESVFYAGREPHGSKVTLDKEDHKEFLRAKMENLKQRKLMESRRKSESDKQDTQIEYRRSKLERVHRTSRVASDVNGLDKENDVTQSRDDYVNEIASSAEPSSGAETPVFTSDFVNKMNQENSDSEAKKDKRKTWPRVEEKSVSLRKNSKPLYDDLGTEGQGQTVSEGHHDLTLKLPSAPLVTPRTPLQTPRNSLVSELAESIDDTSEPTESPTPTSSGRGSRHSSTNDPISLEDSGAATPTPKMDNFSLVETESARSKSSSESLGKSAEVPPKCDNVNTELPQKTKGSKGDSGPPGKARAMPSVGTTPVQTPSLDSKKSKASNPVTRSSGYASDSKVMRSRSHAQEPPQNTARRKERMKGTIQNPDTPPQTPRVGRSRTSSAESDVKSLRRGSASEDATIRTTRTQSQAESQVASRTHSRAEESHPRSSRVQSRAGETPLRTPRTQSRAEETKRTQSRTDDTRETPTPRSRKISSSSQSGRSDSEVQGQKSRAEEAKRTQSRTDDTREAPTPRSRAMSSSSQSGRNDSEVQGQKARKMPSTRSTQKSKPTSLSDSESVAGRSKTVQKEKRSNSEEALRKSGSKVRDAQEAKSKPGVRKPSGYASDKTGDKLPKVSKTETAHLKESQDKKGAPKDGVVSEHKTERRTSTSKEIREIVADRLYQLSRTPSMRRKNYKAGEKANQKTEKDAPSDLESATSSVCETPVRSAAATPLRSAEEQLVEKTKANEVSAEKGVQERKVDEPEEPHQQQNVMGAPAEAVLNESKKISSETGLKNANDETSSKESEAKTETTEESKLPNETDKHVEDVPKSDLSAETLHKSKADKPEAPRQTARHSGEKKDLSQGSVVNSSGYSSDTMRSSVASVERAGSARSSVSTASTQLRKLHSMTSEDEWMTDGSFLSETDNTSAKESMPSDLEDGSQRKRRRRPRRTLPAIPNMADADLEERKKQLFSGAKQRLQRVYTESNYDTDSSANRSDVDGRGHSSRASTLRDEDERLPLYLISASVPDSEDTADDRASISSSTFESSKSDDDEIVRVISQSGRGRHRTFTEELVPPIQTNYQEPLGADDSRSGSKVGTHTEEEIYRAKRNLLRGINVTFKTNKANQNRGYKTDLSEDENGRTHGYVNDRRTGYVSDQTPAMRSGKGRTIGPVLLASGSEAHGLPKQLVPLGTEQEKLFAAKYQLLQQRLDGRQAAVRQDNVDILSLVSPRVVPKNTQNVQTQTDLKRSNLNRPSLQKVLQSCDLITISIERGRYMYFGIRLYEGVFQPLSSNHSLRSPRGKRPLIGQNKSAFMRVRPLENENEIESILAVDRIGDRTAAKQDGRLQEGDYIVEVNGNNVMDRSLLEVHGALESSGTRLELVIARTKVLNLAKEDTSLVPHTDLEKELEKLKLKYNKVLLESQQKDRLIDELRSVIVKKAQVRQVKDGAKNCKINIDLLEGECSAV